MLLPVPISHAPIHERAKWTRDRRTVERRVARWRRKSWVDARAEKFGLSRAWYADDEWWETLAIKQTDIDTREVDRNNRVAIPWEVLIMKGLANQGCRNVAGLRKYKLFMSRDQDRDHSPKMRWRYYLEYHKHGTLEGLVQRYREYNQRHPKHKDYLPEAFIWQAFYDFAQAAYHMSVVRFDDSVAPPGKDHFVLHLDLKHENVLMCEPSTVRNLMDYPTLKVADWGLAEYTSREDVNNSKKWKYYGTIVWTPPEQRNEGTYGRNWRHPVLGSSNHPFTMAHVIWQMGANIYGLMELDLHNLDIHTRVNYYEKSETSLRQDGYSVLSGWQNLRYSSKLRALVDDCLLVDPARRPSVADLLERTQEGIRRFADAARRDGGPPEVRLS
ncbi:serine/threonine protein kinase [Capronia coronata CBS 617.96]|uniref:non-specific serine/threonine protein kinase n=1 Tax=Capronia coronata CBS 617.96 TaxID=1182541 RepID=W9YZP9_9EURO|nr:serine/threonine protein kinase [Capronia coronata CBS 617.96]EXJ95175.1 serine/threonine protein kinase [Capronia coronata CBS 617.96]